MNLGFYYHIPICRVDNVIKVPSYLGVFLQSLAINVKMLTLVMHEASGHEIRECDFDLKNENLCWQNLGFKSSAIGRSLFHRRILKRVMSDLGGLDLFVIRSPSPLAPYFYKYFPHEKTRFLIVGDYSDTLKGDFRFSMRGYLVYLFLQYNNWIFINQIKKTRIVVNSEKLYRKYATISKGIGLISTTTLSSEDFFVREDTCSGDQINLIYTGRFDLEKGLRELLYATSILVKDGFNVYCNMVGWEENNSKTVRDFLTGLAKKLKIENRLVFHEKQRVGAELNAKYRMCDVFVLPSYHEGFPRTIWEAMANCLPVITTPVGAIPERLRNNVHAKFVTPYEVSELADVIKLVISDRVLRMNMISEGYKLAAENTLEKQIPRLLKELL